MCGKLSFVSFLFLFLFAAGTIWPQTEPIPDYQQSLSEPQSSGTPYLQSPSSLDQLLTELSKEALAQEQDLIMLSDQLRLSQIEVSELSDLLKLSREQYKTLETMQSLEIERLTKALKNAMNRLASLESSRNRWRVAAFAGGGLALAVGGLLFMLR